MCCFAFSTILGWGLYGARCIEFLFSEKVIKPFMVAYSLVAILGATANLGLMWSIAETFNGLMAIPNLIALFLLSGTVVRLTKEYFSNRRCKIKKNLSLTQTYRDTADNIFPSALKDRRDHLSRRSFLVQGP